MLRSGLWEHLPDFRKVLQTGLRYVDGVVQRDHMGFTIDPQH